MKVYVLTDNFLKEREQYFFVVVFFTIFRKMKPHFVKKNTLLYNRFHSQILLKDYVFWQFSTPRGYLGGCGKLRNH